MDDQKKMDRQQKKNQLNEMMNNTNQIKSDRSPVLVCVYTTATDMDGSFSILFYFILLEIARNIYEKKIAMKALYRLLKTATTDKWESQSKPRRLFCVSTSRNL